MSQSVSQRGAWLGRGLGSAWLGRGLRRVNLFSEYYSLGNCNEGGGRGKVGMGIGVGMGMGSVGIE